MKDPGSKHNVTGTGYPHTIPTLSRFTAKKAPEGEAQHGRQARSLQSRMKMDAKRQRTRGGAEQRSRELQQGQGRAYQAIILFAGTCCYLYLKASVPFEAISPLEGLYLQFGAPPVRPPPPSPWLAPEPFSSRSPTSAASSCFEGGLASGHGPARCHAMLDLSSPLTRLLPGSGSFLFDNVLMPVRYDGTAARAVSCFKVFLVFYSSRREMLPWFLAVQSPLQPPRAT